MDHLSNIKINAAQARARLESAEGHLMEAMQKRAEAHVYLDSIQQQCPHKWDKPEWCGEDIGAYTIPGDHPGDPGYGGVDRQLPCHVPAKRIDKWRRHCSVCGLTQETTKTEQRIDIKPKF